MRVRKTGDFVVAGFVFLCLSGCGRPDPELPVPLTYPVRSDWLVVNVPSAGGQPTRFQEPGYPLLQQLNRPAGSLVGDELLLVAQINKSIFNTDKVEFDVRDELGRVLTTHFGTPRKPVVPDPAAVIDRMKYHSKLEEKRIQRAEVYNQIRLAQGKKNSHQFKQELDNLQLTAEKLREEMDGLNARIDCLNAYINELKLDPERLARGGSIYRSYCMQCHGLTGDGNGPGGKYLLPLPRDYRSGLFKFINTDPGLGTKRKPLRHDLHHTIIHGLPGSPMPSFAGLTERDVESVTSYVIHLSIRGEAEFDALKIAANPNSDGLSAKEVEDEIVKGAANAIYLWYTSAHAPIVPEENPYTTPDKIEESAANGYKLFMSAEIGCTTCHANFGRGAPYQFDSWGSVVRPRNLTVSTLRGGHSQQAIYARIFGGIPGSNMPAHMQFRPNLEEKVKGINKIWDLVHFVQFVSASEYRKILKDKYQIEIEP